MLKADLQSLNSSSSHSNKSSQKEEIHIPTYSPNLSFEKMLHTARLGNLNLTTSTIMCYAQCIFKPILTKHNSLKKKLRTLHISHALTELMLMRFCLLGSKDDKVSERQSFPISIHSRNSYWTFFIIQHSQGTHLFAC